MSSINGSTFTLAQSSIRRNSEYHPLPLVMQQLLHPMPLEIVVGSPSSAQGAQRAPASDSAVSIETFLNQLNAEGTIGADGDLASFILAEELKQQDSELHTKLGQIRLIAKSREAINSRIIAYRDLLADMKASVKDGKDLKDNSKIDIAALAKRNGDPGKYSDLYVKKDLVISFTDGTVTEVDGSALTEHIQPPDVWNENLRVQLPPPAKEKVDASHVEGEIKRLESMAQQLDSNREVRMISINSAMSKRSNLVQLLSNMSKKKSDTETAVIRNFG